MNFSHRTCGVPAKRRAFSSITATPEALSLAPGAPGTRGSFAQRHSHVAGASIAEHVRIQGFSVDRIDVRADDEVVTEAAQLAGDVADAPALAARGADPNTDVAGELAYVVHRSRLVERADPVCFRPSARSSGRGVTVVAGGVALVCDHRLPDPLLSRGAVVDACTRTGDEDGESGG